MTAIALTIAGSDSGGCAGIQADLKTFSALGVFGTTAITALTAQNTLGVDAVAVMTPQFVTRQIDAVISDIGVDAIKTGMLANTGIVQAVCAAIGRHGRPVLVVDPVMVATSGARLIDADASTALIGELAPLARLITPNLAEAEVMLGQKIEPTVSALKSAALALAQHCQTSVLLKGGHFEADAAIDIVVIDGRCEVLSSPWTQTRNTHGTGCTLSAAITAYLALGESLPGAVARGKTYISAAIAHSDQLAVGEGNGPVHHFYAQW